MFLSNLFSISQLKNLFKKLSKKDNKINTFKNFVILLESRLDINVLRFRLARTVFQAKQLINHNKIKVNDKIVNKPKIANNFIKSLFIFSILVYF